MFKSLTSIGYGLERDNEVKMRSLGWALIQYDWCPIRRGDLDTNSTEGRQCEDQGRRQLSTRQRERSQRNMKQEKSVFL